MRPMSRWEAIKSNWICSVLIALILVCLIMAVVIPVAIPYKIIFAIASVIFFFAGVKLVSGIRRSTYVCMDCGMISTRGDLKCYRCVKRE